MKEMRCGSQSVYSVRQREIPQTKSFKKITILQTCSILTLF